MSSFNRVILLGNLTRDPEVRYSPGGNNTAVCTFSLAVNKKIKSSSGTSSEEVSYIDIIVFGKQGEACGQYLTKGSPALIDGRLQQRRWDDRQTGQKRSKIEVVGEHVLFMPRGNRTQDTSVPPDIKEAFPEAAPADDEIPF